MGAWKTKYHICCHNFCESRIVVRCQKILFAKVITQNLSLSTIPTLWAMISKVIFAPMYNCFSMELFSLLCMPWLSDFCCFNHCQHTTNNAKMKKFPLSIISVYQIMSPFHKKISTLILNTHSLAWCFFGFIEKHQSQAFSIVTSILSLISGWHQLITHLKWWHMSHLHFKRWICTCN